MMEEASSFATNVSESHMHTRSRCLGGTSCAAVCPLHVHRRKRTSNLTAIASINTEASSEQQNHVPEVFDNGQQDLTTAENNSHDGSHQLEEDDSNDEQVPIIRKETRICTRMIRSTYRNIITEHAKKLAKAITSVISPYILWPLLIVITGIVIWTFGIPGHLLTCITYIISASASLLSQSATIIKSLLPERSVDYSSPISCEKDVTEAIRKLSEHIILLESEQRTVRGELDNFKIITASNDSRHSAEYVRLDKRSKHLEMQIKNNQKGCGKIAEENADLMLRINSIWFGVFPKLAGKPGSSQFYLEVRDAIKTLAIEAIEPIIVKTADELNIIKRKIDESAHLVLQRVETIFSARQSEQQVVISAETSDQKVRLNYVKQLIKEALAVYDADKTGLHDFALEPAGGSVVNIRSSETYDPHVVKYRIFNIPVWSSSNSPRTVIQPSISPGECWAFKGFEGHLVLKLSEKIVPTSFTYEHIPKEISREGQISSAPAKFQVRGLNDENDRDGDILGNFEYLDNGQPLQNFAVQDPNPKAYHFIELSVLSNQGHIEYTCLYRFRVHGRQASL